MEKSIIEKTVQQHHISPNHNTSTASQTCIPPMIHRKPLPEPGTYSTTTTSTTSFPAKPKPNPNPPYEPQSFPTTHSTNLSSLEPEKALEAEYTHDHKRNIPKTAIHPIRNTTTPKPFEVQASTYSSSNKGPSYHYNANEQEQKQQHHPPSYTFLNTTPTTNKHLPPTNPPTLITTLRNKIHTNPIYLRISHLPPLKRRLILILAPLLILLLIILILGITIPLTHRQSSQFSNLPLPTTNGPYQGDLTYYDPGLGACGRESTSTDFVVSVSHMIFDAVGTGSNPNMNPLCGMRVRAVRGGKAADLVVVDRCTGCQARDLDVTRSVFAGLADLDQGRVTVSWAWLESVPGNATGL